MKYFSVLIFAAWGCLAQEKRSALTVNLAFDAEQYYTADIPESPYFVKEGVLQIYPGEELNVEAQVKDDKLVNMKVVKKVTHPQSTISVRFYQDAEDRTKAQMVLVVKNPFDRKLQYDGIIYIPKHDKWSRTSILPVMPKLVGYEMWPDVIATMALENWRFVD